MQVLKKVLILMLFVPLMACTTINADREETTLILNSIESKEDLEFWKCYFKPKWYETNNMTVERCLDNIE